MNPETHATDLDTAAAEGRYFRALTSYLVPGATRPLEMSEERFIQELAELEQRIADIEIRVFA